MRVGGNADYLAEINNRDELKEAVQWAKSKSVPVKMIGDGSNLFWADGGFRGLILVNRIKEIKRFNEDSENVYLTVGGGENWDSVVAMTVEDGLTGIEALSLIPGTAGATPVQNVGAYGQEISQTLVSVEAFNVELEQFENIPVIDCNFGYRTSRFKTTDKDKFLISAITLHLRKGQLKPPFYASLQTYFDEHKITDANPKSVRNAVIAIRSSKLPDPAKIANNGSFFSNPIIDEVTFFELKDRYPEIRYWQTKDGNYKLAAGWMVEQAGFKGVHDQDTGMATWPKQALVLVNEHAKGAADVLKFKQKIVESVSAKFGVTLEQEPEYVG